MSLPKYSELTSIHRGDPCQEYPGKWLLNLPLPYEGKTQYEYPTVGAARIWALRILNSFEESKQEYDPSKTSISWECSDNDPRVGQVWFTGYYMHGRYNIFGSYNIT